MPVIRVEWLAGRSDEQKKEVAEVFTRELARIGGCGIDHVQVVFADIAHSDWAVAGVMNQKK